MRNETDKAVEILERKQRETQLELLELVEELRREIEQRDAEIAMLRARVKEFEAELRAQWIGCEGRVA